VADQGGGCPVTGKLWPQTVNISAGESLLITTPYLKMKVSTVEGVRLLKMEKNGGKYL
jgi:hypothetical protein